MTVAQNQYLLNTLKSLKCQLSSSKCSNTVHGFVIQFLGGYFTKMEVFNPIYFLGPSKCPNKRGYSIWFLFINVTSVSFYFIKLELEERELSLVSPVSVLSFVRKVDKRRLSQTVYLSNWKNIKLFITQRKLADILFSPK